MHHQSHPSYLYLLIAGFTLLLSGCQNTPANNLSAIQLSGLAFEQMPLAHAQIQLIDAQGKQLRTTADVSGRYSFSLDGIKAPLLLSVVAAGDAADCTKNSVLRPICMAAVIDKFTSDRIQTGNINALTDRIVSELAVAQGFIGPQQWVNSQKISEHSLSQLQTALAEQRRGFKQALKLSKINHPDSFNPATYPIQTNDSLTELLSLLHHNRNYDNNSGEAGHTSLSDISFRPIVGLMPTGKYENFDLTRARQELQKIKAAKQRIFILGDSTSAIYEQLRFPRMGWGQAFSAQLKPASNIQVIVGSRAGRSSRDFYNGRD